MTSVLRTVVASHELPDVAADFARDPVTCCRTLAERLGCTFRAAMSAASERWPAQYRAWMQAQPPMKG